MNEKVDAPVSVVLDYNHKTRSTRPIQITWENRDYPITKIGYHHQYYTGRVRFHVFSVTTPGNFFRLELNTDTLQWRVKEIADDLPD